ncbi:FR47-like family protein [Anoxybacillus sp. B7M1]|jgi:DNA-binding MarR family transcriptional regulator/GNAT superfamily N-acetyltransferase|uniref:Bifunctional helix-turn-helix transcriptional regulator/GNAT family N-acetyltransferase n=1 Tax=Anoxybacteroides rupiense TaxID=311460 RepID=A0ABD5ITM7_9BACL|nr:MULTISPECIES: bifunctional helix-turn-helix transcriptional regulator/GNAT family N-acetyltransferase [Anoxybacillus]ANB57498.1 FR47-like family protein [Anoxybacillus sp. B2M1]ANB65817.1 FR47-like family protein [Anoxybacillus sp. B7M1]KXG10770.1 Organic hydroperoxide resistance transcriptional regulator [Anoxybacillus sp. P3H1B]MBB3905934.1 DNA-binding MarR family transcriptional regulator/GNAT superfamily N-acetyltransferase [Anoxybacillus rupiensis]MED5051657.1 bifunctional helix-turn-h
MIFEERINAVRHFNRFITRQIGALQEGLLHSPYSLTESRILFEIANHSQITASDLTRQLGLDPGYLSRILTRLEEQGVIYKERSETDGRQRILKLTSEGKAVFSLLNQRSYDEVSEFLSELSDIEQQQLIHAMQTIEGILTKNRRFKFSGPYFLRQHEPGDMGWIVHKHGALYAKEYGWNEQFEALVAQIVADFINHYNPDKERCWIAEMNGDIVGSVMVVHESDAIAKLRLLLVDPQARGLGLGTHLVQECIRFAKRKEYQKLVLWTNSVLIAARHIYQKLGFTLVAEEKHHSFGHELIGETWELEL